MKFKVNIEAKNAKKKLKQSMKKIQNISDITVKQLSHLGRDYAKTIVPRDTNKTANLIIAGRVKGQVNGSLATVFSQNSTAKRSDGFNLPLWMATSPKAQNWFNNGKYNYMKLTAEFLNSIKMRTAEAAKNKVLIR